MTALEKRIMDYLKSLDYGGSTASLYYFEELDALQAKGASISDALDRASKEEIIAAFESLYRQGYLEKDEEWGGNGPIYAIKAAPASEKSNASGQKLTDLEEVILEVVKMGDGRGDLPKLVYYRYLRTLTDRGMSMEMAMQCIREERVAEVMESLCAKGYLEKQSNWNGTEMLYFVRQTEPVAQGNYMATVLAKFASADEEELIDTANEALRIFITASGMTDATRIFQAMLLGANVGFGGAHSLTDKQKNLVNEVIGKAYKGSVEDLYSSICKDIDENTYNILNLFCTVGQDRVGMPLLYYILCFAYIDGKPSQELVNRLEQTFSMALLMHFMKNAPDDEAEEQERREAEEKERREAEEKARLEEKKRKEAEEAKRKEEEEAAYHSALSEWTQKSEAITAARAAEVDKRILQEQQAIETAAKKEAAEAIRVNKEILAQQRERKADAEAALSALGFFAFGEKKQQKGIVDEAAALIAQAKQALADAKQKYEATMASAGEAARKKKAAIEKEVAAGMPIPEKPAMPRHMIPNPNQAQYDAILEYMAPGAMYTVSMLMEGIYGYDSHMTNQRLAAILRQMTDKGLLERTEQNRKAYFMIAG